MFVTFCSEAAPVIISAYTLSLLMVNCLLIDNIRPMDWKLISATVIIRVSRPRAEWLVVLRIT